MLRGLLLVLTGLAAGFVIAWWRAPVATRAGTPLLPNTSYSSAVAPRLAGNDVAALAAGFAPDRVEWIAQRTAELRMAQLQAQYDSAREGKPFDQAAVLAGERTLRSDLGDADYGKRVFDFRGR